MNGTLAQLIALISYGNTFLMNPHTEHKLVMENSTLKYCNRLVFAGKDLPQDVNTPIDKNIQDWFNYLKNTHCKRLKLCYNHSANKTSSADHETAGFVGGGGIWLIGAVYDKSTQYWVGSEKVTKSDAKDNRIWSVRYSQVSINQPLSESIRSLIKAKQNLSSILTRITVFANAQHLEYWGDIFDKANKNLDSTEPSVNYYNDFIVPQNHSLLARQVLFSASKAWVFGGMGSWNDIMFKNMDDEKLNKDLSSALYESVIESIVASVNSNI